jgi:hypothetical protein
MRDAHMIAFALKKGRVGGLAGRFAPAVGSDKTTKDIKERKENS